MRKTLLATSAIVAALAFAGAASAQNVSVQSTQINRGAQNATVRIVTPQVGAALTGNGAAIGNLYDIEGARVGQGIAEVGSNLGGNAALQGNYADQTSSVTVIAPTASSADIASTAAGNAVNISGVQVHTAGSRRLNQLNDATVQSANLNLDGGLVGGLYEGSAAAIGNTVSAEGVSSVNLGGGNAGGELRQTNNGRQIANLSVSGGNFGAGDFVGQAAGNAFSATAPSVNVGWGTTQTNTNSQSVTANVNGTRAVTLDVAGTALGNSISLNGGASNGNGTSQANGSTQTSTVNVGAVAVGGDLTVSSAAVGNAFSVANTGSTFVAGGSQTNFGVQSSTLNLTSNTSNQLIGSAQSVGNLLSLSSLNAGANTSMPQLNGTGQTSSLTSNFGVVGGAATLSSLSVGNFTSLTGAGSIESVTGAQTNQALQSSFTTINSGSFGSLTAGASSIGNVTNVTIR